MVACGPKMQGALEGAPSAIQASDVLTDSRLKTSYAIGFDIAAALTDQGIDVDADALGLGLRQRLGGGDTLMTGQEVAVALDTFREEQMAAVAAEQEALAAENLTAGVAFLAEMATHEGITATDSGVLYEVISLTEDAEAAMPTADDVVTVNYRGKLIDGTVFDSSFDRGEPATFALANVIPGWTEGVQLMHVGDSYRFYIPSELAYSEHGAGAIGPNAALIFDVDLLSIGEPEAPTSAGVDATLAE